MILGLASHALAPQSVSRGPRRSLAIGVALVLGGVFGFGFIAVPSAQTQTLTTLYNFTGDPDGSAPVAPLVRDAAGNLYGTTYVGGTNNGTVFELSSQGVETILHTFRGKPDGSQPWAGLVRDPEGNLYGTTANGGAFNFGTVFKINKAGKERVLHSFTGAPDGATPFSAGLILDSKGNIYGTTLDGGSGICTDGGQGCGTVFMLTPSGAETVLYSFAGGTDGEHPEGLVRDADGNLYGITSEGGETPCTDLSVNGCGTVFKLSNTGMETVLHRFAGYSSDGERPQGSLIIGPRGNLYGTTEHGGTFGSGTVFESTRSGTENLLYSFGGTANDGLNPVAGLVGDGAGNFYGTTLLGGGTGCAGSGCGTVFKVTTKGQESLLYVFGDQTGGSVPFAALIRDAAGNLYGTTSNGGTSGGPGTVFKLTP